MRLVLFILVSIILSVASCRNPSKNFESATKTKVIGSCRHSKVGFCLEYKSLAPGVSGKELKDSCVDQKADWVESVCPDQNKFAGCDFSHDVGVGSTYFYSPYEPSDAKNICTEQHGKYRSIP